MIYGVGKSYPKHVTLETQSATHPAQKSMLVADLGGDLRVMANKGRPSRR